MNRKFQIKFRLSFYEDTARRKFSDEYKIVDIDGVCTSLVEEGRAGFIRFEIYCAESDEPFTLVLIRKGKKEPKMNATVVNGSPYQPSIFSL
jgi:hypothetical protein